MWLWSVLVVTLPSAAVLAHRTWDVRPWVTWLGCVVLAPAEGDSAHGIVWSVSIWRPRGPRGPSGTTLAVSRMAAVPAVNVKLGGPRTSVLGFLVFGSVFVVFWKWDSFSWHARGMILAAYGVVCLGAGLIPALRTRGLLESGAQAQGTVVDVKKGTSSGQYSSGQYGGSTYNPVVRFTAADGRTVEFKSTVGYSRSPDIGGAVPVRYRRGDPEQAEIDRATMWMIPAAFGLVGGLGLLVAAVIVYSSQVSKAAPTAAATVTSPPSPAATSTTTPSAASTTPGSSPVSGTPGTGRLGAKVVPVPAGFTLVLRCVQRADKSRRFQPVLGRSRQPPFCPRLRRHLRQQRRQRQHRGDLVPIRYPSGRGRFQG